MKEPREKAEYEHVEHIFGPVYDEHSKILILGSMPSVKSREQQFYYGHPQNRFWKVLSAVIGEQVPEAIAEKRAFLLKNNVALWDVIESCDIIDSADSSIKNVKENNMRVILDKAEIKAIFVNGGKAHELFLKYCMGYIEDKQRLWKKPNLIKLPSTSPANAAWSLDKLIAAWKDKISIYL